MKCSTKLKTISVAFTIGLAIAMFLEWRIFFEAPYWLALSMSGGTSLVVFLILWHISVDVESTEDNSFQLHQNEGEKKKP